MVMVVTTPHYQFVSVDWLLVLHGKISSGLIANQMFFTRSFTAVPVLQHRLFANVSSHSLNHNLYFRFGGWVGQPYIGRQTRQQTQILLSYFTAPARSILTKREAGSMEDTCQQLCYMLWFHLVVLVLGWVGTSVGLGCRPGSTCRSGQGRQAGRQVGGDAQIQEAGRQGGRDAQLALQAGSKWHQGAQLQLCTAACSLSGYLFLPLVKACLANPLWPWRRCVETTWHVLDRWIQVVSVE